MPWTLPLARGRALRIDHPIVMGILNVTPDSFSDGGRLATPDHVREAARAMLQAGATILDVGGESTRPGAVPVSAELEVRRVIPAITVARRISPDAVVSIDTSKAEVAQAALAAGADMVNDVSGLADAAMAGVVAGHGCSVVLMRSAPCEGDVVAAAARQTAALLARARSAGIPDTAVLLDPGLGFGDPPGGEPTANLALLRNAAALGHGRPVVVGASRKRFIGRLTNVKEPDRRLAGSLAAAVLAVEGGAAVVRAHDVAETVQALRVTSA
ncbi:MAG: dihydropteroate synthase [Halobacteriales archaeon]|nr:dihydropteroate synthase [Halobacteriales archaeon]